MRGKLLLLSAPVISLLIIATTLYLRSTVPYQYPEWHTSHAKPIHDLEPARELEHDDAPPRDSVVDGKVLPASNITQYLDAILTEKASALPTLQCPAMNQTRYEYMRASSTSGPPIQYVFALNLRQNLALLPRLLGSIVEAIRFLGPSHCALSIVEGNSADGTADVLAALRPGLEKLGITYHFKSSEIDPSESKPARIVRLAQLRNMALEPMLVPGGPNHISRTEDTTVIFLNDVCACVDDILELVHQKKVTGADMTCAMDWTYVGRDPTFYDVWIARGINGDSFFDIPADGNWDSAWNLFWNAGETNERFSDLRPFQVFSCWNGAAAFSAAPLVRDGIRFRAANETAGECVQGEPQLFCKDLWHHGYGRIAVVPSVNLEYSVEKANMIKLAKGFTSDTVAAQDPAGDAIDWRPEPPEKVKCMPSWANQFWQLWNETLRR